jgi:hypothetical protein
LFVSLRERSARAIYFFQNKKFGSSKKEKGNGIQTPISGKKITKCSKKKKINRFFSGSPPPIPASNHKEAQRRITLPN